MARITYNNSELQSNIITFTDIPNILKVEDSGYGTYASMTFTFQSNLSTVTTGDSQWNISFLGETITNVISPANAINKNFYISSGNTSTAASAARALRNCPTLSANFSIQHSGDSVVLTAKSIGKVWGNTQNYIDYNIPSTYLSVNGVDGTSSSNLLGAKIDVDIYSDNEYITTLEKNYYGSEAAFNLSPVLTTFAEYGRIKPYTLKVSTIINGEYELLGNVDTNYISIGYLCNQGYKFLSNDFSTIAQNYSRGEERGEIENRTLLYIYEPKIDISLYTANSGGFSYQIDYLDSAYNVITSVTSSIRTQANSLVDLSFPLNSMHESGTFDFNNSFYIDLSIGNRKIRYNVIKPIKATEYSQRIYWRNSYGGISFFDFTGQKTESRDVEISTYEKNIFGFYTDTLSNLPLNELEKIYNNNVKYSVTLKSHLFENDGKYIFNDLLQSANVWTEINSQMYNIIIDSVSVDETDNNGIYEASIKYHYSAEPSLL